MVELNRAAAVGFAVGPQAGLELLERLLADPRSSATSRCTPRMPNCSGGPATTRPPRAYERAIALSANAVERAELRRRLSTLDAD